MFVCFSIAFLCFASTLAAAMPSRAAFNAALEALNTIDVGAIITFVVSLPKELALLYRSVLIEYRAAISGSSVAWVAHETESTPIVNDPVQVCNSVTAPIHTTVAKVTRASSRAAAVKKLCAPAPVSTGARTLPAEIRNSSYQQCEELIYVLFLTAMFFCLMKLYTYSVRVISIALTEWRKSNAASLVVQPKWTQLYQSADCKEEVRLAFADLIQARNNVKISSPMALKPHGYIDFPSPCHAATRLKKRWKTYSANEGAYQAICVEFIQNVKGSISFDTLHAASPASSETPGSSAGDSLSKHEIAMQAAPRVAKLISLERTFSTIAAALQDMQREPKINSSTPPDVTIQEACERIRMYTQQVFDFEGSITHSLALMSLVASYMKYLEKTESICYHENRKAPRLQERIAACYEFLKTKFLFEETEFYECIRYAYELTRRDLSPGELRDIEKSYIRHAYSELRQFLLRKDAMLASMLDECLSTVRECEELRSSVTKLRANDITSNSLD